jgi:hypothetical protein
MLGGGPASQHPHAQTQQIRGAMPRAVTPLPSPYPQLYAFFMRFFSKAPVRRAVARCDVMLNDLLQQRRAVLFINLKPRRG